MSTRNLMPWNRRNSAVTEGSEHPVMSLQREMNRLFEDMFRGFDVGFPANLSSVGFNSAWPRLEVTEDEKEVRVVAELPGMEEKDVEVLLEDNVLTLRGEKRSETEDSKRKFSERFYGRFERRIPLGHDIDESKIKASFKNGTLDIVLPKDQAAQSRVKRIPVGS